MTREEQQMSDLRALYQEVILDHSKAPRNFGKLAEGRHAEGFNPLCGDRLTLYLNVDGDVVADARFEGSGCAISTASASMMTEMVKGKTIADAEKIFEAFHDLVTGEANEGSDEELLGKLAVFAGVQEYPTRVKCATLAWHTLKAACHESDAPVSTE